MNDPRPLINPRLNQEIGRLREFERPDDLIGQITYDHSMRRRFQLPVDRATQAVGLVILAGGIVSGVAVGMTVSRFGYLLLIPAAIGAGIFLGSERVARTCFPRLLHRSREAVAETVRERLDSEWIDPENPVHTEFALTKQIKRSDLPSDRGQLVTVRLPEGEPVRVSVSCLDTGSEYFNHLLAGRFHIPEEFTLTEDVARAQAAAVIMYLDGRTIELTQENVQDTMTTADALAVPSLAEECERFLLELVQHSFDYDNVSALVTILQERSTEAHRATLRRLTVAKTAYWTEHRLWRSDNERQAWFGLCQAQGV